MIVLDVWSDIVCPWCWIGHTRLRRALAGVEDVVVRPRAFELRPDTPGEGVPVAEAYHAKFGGPEGWARAFRRVADEGAKDGLELRHDGLERAPNSRLGHRLVALAAAEGHGLAALDALFAAHHHENADIGDAAVATVRVAAATGLGAAALAQALAGGAAQDEVLADEAQARELGITGVPCFAILDAGIGVSGAQPPELLAQFVQAGRERAAA